MSFEVAKGNYCSVYIYIKLILCFFLVKKCVVHQEIKCKMSVCQFVSINLRLLE